ncbi:hypothetical protein DMC61_04830 [Amycolatopsis sp. WAC 04169]|uniref:DUF6204 family protein n=1 Tax=Amycolatopsis sp. WAC 04169 TaxID=2203197 RepID=UPI000F7892F5|nr:DUF6204 family protein [Amycolatopsis sp. WAC 04169]RSN37374.1 hypothetical protein DMC61_04830 [Amycolatopsis sp. WAC 04169]
MPTYRVLVNGKFDHPEADTRSRLLAELSDHQAIGFTEDGLLTYSAHLGAFTFRITLQGEEERDVLDEAELKVMEMLDAKGYPYRDVAGKATCMDDIKIRRR